MRGARLFPARAALCLAAALAGGCASGGPPRAVDAGRAPIRGSWLFRAEVEGRGGGGSVKLTLRRHDEDSFELAAADVLGQTRWRLVADGGEALWIDTGRSRFCRLRESDGIPAGELRSELKVGDLPGLLLGELPRAAAGELPDAGAAELAEGSGRIYRGERAAGRWKSWTLQREGRPVLWYRQESAAGEAMLSGRDPAFVLRWRLSAHGELPAAAAPALAPPAGFAEESCTDAAAA